MDKKIIYIEPCAGLGNRLLALGSAIYWSQRLDRKLIVLWKKEPVCAVGWDKIFTAKTEFDVKEYNQMPKKLNNVVKVYLDSMVLAREVKNVPMMDCMEVESLWSEDNIRAFEEKIPTDSECFYIRSYGRFAPAKELAECIRSLPFSDEIIERVDGIMKGAAAMYGVHIRRTDHIDAIRMSPTSLYEEKMSEVSRQDSNCCFFIASDDQKEIDNLKSKFNCVTAPKFAATISRDSDEGIMDAAVDMLCLSKCKKIFGAYGSTFSLMASVIGDVPLEVVAKE